MSEDAAGAAKRAEVFGKEGGDGSAIAPELRLKERLFKFLQLLQQGCGVVAYSAGTSSPLTVTLTWAVTSRCSFTGT